MPYDPNIPATNAELTSAMFRGQFQGLAALIAAIQNITAAQIDGVTTLLPSEAATVGLTVSGDTMHFTFGIPKGDEGVQGIQGIQGPSFATAVIDSVTSLPAADVATVSVNFDGTNVHFNFGIPRGQTGDSGTNGSDGGAGPQGDPGEVSLAQLTMAINTTSTNSNGVVTMDTAFANDPPTLADLELMRAKMNELILALRR